MLTAFPLALVLVLLETCPSEIPLAYSGGNFVSVRFLTVYVHEYMPREVEPMVECRHRIDNAQPTCKR